MGTEIEGKLESEEAAVVPDPSLDPDSEFNAAFDIAEKVVEAELTPADNPANFKEADEKVVDEKAGGETPPIIDEKPAGQPPDPTLVTSPAIPIPTPAEDTTYEQKWKTLQGIWQHDKESWETEKARLLAEVQTIKSQPAISPEPKKDPSSFMDLLTDKEKAELADYDSEFDLVSKMEGKKRDLALKRLEEKFDSRLNEMMESLKPVNEFTAQTRERFANEAEELHFSSIAQSHSDYEKYVNDGSITNWIASKPKYLQGGLQAIYESGTASDIVDMLSDFKKETGIIPPVQTTPDTPQNVVNIDSKKAERKQAMTAVTTRRGAVNAAMSQANDFESAFDEALNRQGG